MKKISLFFALLFFALCSNAQIKGGGTFFATTKGVAPIPAFGIKESAGFAAANLNLGKGWEFNPDFAFTLGEGNPWFSDLWARKSFFLDSNKLIMTASVDWSYIFQPYTGSDGKTIIQSVTYPTAEGKIKFIANKNNTVVFDYWYTQAIQKAFGIKGSYVSIAYKYSHSLGKISFDINPNIFYLNYSDGTKGFFSSLSAVITHKKTGLFLAGQLIKKLNAGTNNSNLTVGINF